MEDIFHKKDFFHPNITRDSKGQGMKTLVIAEDTEICTLSHTPGQQCVSDS